MLNSVSDPENSLEPPLNRTGGPSAEVIQARATQGSAAANNRDIYEPRIDAHLEAHRGALEFLRRTHESIADNYDFDVDGETRYAASWQMAGRCLGVALLMVDSLQLGYTAELPHLARALHEADRLLDLFLMPNEDDLLRRWLSGGKISPSDARKAEERYGATISQEMREAGIDDEGNLNVGAGLSRTMYSKLSEPAHHFRKWTEDAVAPDLRQMIVGPAEAWERRAATVASMVAVVEECILSVGDALAHFMPPGWWDEHIERYRKSFALLIKNQPLTEG